MLAISVEVIESVDALAAIEPEWRGLWERDPAVSPFESPDWLLPWTRWLWGGGKLRVLALRRTGDLVALCPPFLWGYGSQPRILCVSFLGSGISTISV